MCSLLLSITSRKSSRFGYIDTQAKQATYEAFNWLPVTSGPTVHVTVRASPA